MRVLLIEDDLHAGQSAFLALKNANYGVDWVHDS
jgi:DNA-binding response OmpR family regulator